MSHIEGTLLLQNLGYQVMKCACGKNQNLIALFFTRALCLVEVNVGSNISSNLYYLYIGPYENMLLTHPLSN